MRKNTTIFDMYKENKHQEIIDQLIENESELLDKAQYDMTKCKSSVVIKELPFIVKLWKFLK